MKLKASIMAIFAAALGMSLTSCVDPYYAGGAPQHGGGYGGGGYGGGYRPGYEVRTLPSGYRTETIGGSRYYYHNNVYYQTRGRGYVVVDAPRRGPSRGPYQPSYNQGSDYRRGPDYRGQGQGNVTIIRDLPRGSKVVTHNGQRYYRSGNVYYQSRQSGYVVVRNPY